VLSRGRPQPAAAGEPRQPARRPLTALLQASFGPDVVIGEEFAERRLGFPVNPTLASRKRWAAAQDPLIQQVQASPVVVAVAHDA